MYYSRFDIRDPTREFRRLFRTATPACDRVAVDAAVETRIDRTDPRTDITIGILDG